MSELRTSEKEMITRWQRDDELLALNPPNELLPLLFYPRILTESFLPKKRTYERELVRNYHNVKVSVRTIDGGILPFGVMARKLLIYFTTRATQLKSRTVKLNVTEKDLFDVLGMSRNLKSTKHLRTQIKRLAALTIEIDYKPNKAKRILYRGVVFSRIQLECDDEQLPMFASEIEFAEDFYKHVASRCMPFQTHHLARLNSSLSLDLYLWLAIRLPNIRHGEDVKLSISQLAEQFGRCDSPVNVHNLSRSIQTALERIFSVWGGVDESVSYDRKKMILKLRYSPDLVPLKRQASGGW